MAQPPPPNATSPDHFFLKSVAVTGAAETSKYTSRFLRYTGGGSTSIVLTETPPVFFSFHIDDAGRLLASSSRPQDVGRVWGFVIAADDEGTGSCVVPVEIHEGRTAGTDGEFYFEKVEDEEGRGTRSVLKWRSDGKRGETAGAWKGWLLRDSPPDVFMGCPQLYWKFEGPSGGGEDMKDDGVGSGEGRVDFIREEVKRA